MDSNFQRALSRVLKHEGRYVDHPKDPGGATNKGVTIATFRRYVKPNGTKADLRAITEDLVATVYYKHYWAAVHANELPAGVDYAVFDLAVNSGPSRAARSLQRVVGRRGRPHRTGDAGGYQEGRSDRGGRETLRRAACPAEDAEDLADLRKKMGAACY